MELKQENIEFDPSTGKLFTYITIKLVDGNGMLLKAKAELCADIMDGIGKIVEAKEAEYEEVYGAEVIQHTHCNEDVGAPEDISVTASPRKYVGCKEVQKKLLERAFPKPQ